MDLSILTGATPEKAQKLTSAPSNANGADAEDGSPKFEIGTASEESPQNAEYPHSLQTHSRGKVADAGNPQEQPNVQTAESISGEAVLQNRLSAEGELPVVQSMAQAASERTANARPQSTGLISRDLTGLQIHTDSQSNTKSADAQIALTLTNANQAPGQAIQTIAREASLSKNGALSGSPGAPASVEATRQNANTGEVVDAPTGTKRATSAGESQPAHYKNQSSAHHISSTEKFGNAVRVQADPIIDDTPKPRFGDLKLANEPMGIARTGEQIASVARGGSKQPDTTQLGETVARNPQTQSVSIDRSQLRASAEEITSSAQRNANPESKEQLPGHAQLRALPSAGGAAEMPPAAENKSLLDRLPSLQVSAQNDSGKKQQVQHYASHGSSMSTAPSTNPQSGVLSPTSSIATTPGQPLPSPERDLATQIVSAANTRGNGGVVNLTLDPPELGRLEIVMEIADQGLRATLTAERQSTGDMIKRHLELLAEQFEDAGFDDIDLNFGEPSLTGGDAETGERDPVNEPSSATITTETQATARSNRLVSAIGQIDMRL